MTMTVERAFWIADDCGFEVCLREDEQDALIALAAEVRRLRAENSMLTEQRDENAQNSATATTQCLAYQQEIADLREQLAQQVSTRDEAIRALNLELSQERNRLDWALTSGAWYWPVAKVLMWHPIPMREIRRPSKDPRTTIDELIAAEAAGGGK